MNPVEHCGAFPPSISGVPTTDLHRECALRPGHQGSHANEEGMRWIMFSGPTCGTHSGPCFPEPEARCSAHGDSECAHCHRNPADCAEADPACGTWGRTGMHWDTCSNRMRGPLQPG